MDRREWVNSVLHPNLKKAWNDPSHLATLIIRSFEDGWFAECEAAAIHLQTIDPRPQRAATLLGIIYENTGRSAMAEEIYLRYLDLHGAEGNILTNLAKSQHSLGRQMEGEATLWKALETNPNLDNACAWYESIHRERSGPAGAIAALKRLAALPGSWRAQFHLAHHELDARNLDAALQLYRDGLKNCPPPPPSDVLLMLSGELGKRGHLPEMIDLLAPVFDPAAHEINVGNNLLNAYFDTGNLDAARKVIRQLQLQARTDWRQTLDHWEHELAKAEASIREPVREIRISVMPVQGPIWLRRGGATDSLYLEKKIDAPCVAFFGNSVASLQPPLPVILGPSDAPGRMCRAIPLLLAESLYLATDAQTLAFFPWNRNGGGHVVKTYAEDPVELCPMIRHFAAQVSPRPSQYGIFTHVITHGENWKLELRVVRIIDATVISESGYDFAEGNYGAIAHRVYKDMEKILEREGGVMIRTRRGLVIDPVDVDDYLIRLGQCLSIRCLTLEGNRKDSLINPAEILNGAIQLCLDNPEHVPSHALLVRTFLGLRESDPELVRSFRKNAEALQKGCKLEWVVQNLLFADLQKAFE